ncbi:MAG: TrkA family potassium uptake protein [Microbacterium sp.]
MAKFSLFGDNSRRIAEADSVVVIGLGRFGTSLALELMSSGTDVLGIDSDEETVQALNGQLTQVVRADSTKEEALRQLAVPEFDRVVVAIGDDVQASILTASLLLQLKVPVVWAKAVSEQHGTILEQLGVHHVIYPEKDMGRRVAHLVRGAAIDYLEIDKGYSLVKATVPSGFLGVPLGQTNLRQQHGVTIAAFRDSNGMWQNADNATVLAAGDAVLIVGPTAKAEAFAQLR